MVNMYGHMPAHMASLEDTRKKSGRLMGDVSGLR
jgi:hypothetical protein